MLDFNTEPYNDDFDEANKFYRILFRPSFAVQARELTQLQSILQNQIKRNGDAIFKQGAMVIPGQISIDKNYHYVKLQDFYAGSVTETYVANLVGQTIVGQTSGVSAIVLHVEHAVGADPTTIYVRYVDSGTSNTSKTFTDNEILTDSVNTPVQAIASGATGTGSAAVIQRGVYYINGFFVLCDNQTIVLDKYTNTPTYRIGLKVTESKVTPEANETLLDNAQNSYNYAAPGAHRYFIDLTLTALAIDSTADTNFIELLTTVAGTTQRAVTTTAYSEIEKTLARRTYDEAGNYTVSKFGIDVREHRSNDRGAWKASTAYLIGDVVTSNGNTYVAKISATSVNIPPTHTSGDAYDGSSSTGVDWTFTTNPVYNRGIYTPEQGGNEAKLAVGLEPGKAYVDGYEIEKIVTEYVDVDKARDFAQTSESYVQAPIGNYVLVTNLNSLPPFDATTGFAPVTIYNRVTSSNGTAPSSASVVGTVRIKSITWDSGTVSSNSGIYKLHLFDLNLNSGYDFARDAKSFYYNRSDSNLNFTANINPISKILAGSVTTYSSYPTKGASTTLTGIGTAFSGGTTTSPALKVGDYVLVNTTSGDVLRRVVTITNNGSIVVDSSVTADGGIVKLVTTNIVEPQNASLVFQLPDYAIKSVRNADGVKDIIYYATEYISGTTGSPTGTPGAPGAYCTLTVNTPAGVFASGAETDNYVLIWNDATNGGAVVSPLAISAGGSSSITFTIDCSSVNYSGTNFLVMATIKKLGSDGGEKTKTLNSTSVTFTSQSVASGAYLPLGKADIFRITSVMMKSGTWGAEGATYSIDITDRYDLDNGQRDSFYDMGGLILKNSFAPPSASVQVSFDYFSHSTGDYFTVNSYPPTVKYSDILSYNKTSLRDVIDFRPRINDAGTGFSGSGSSYSLVPKRGTDITASYSYYYSRKDKIAIDFSGKFFDIRGIPAKSPSMPANPALGMILYGLTIEPYTFSTSSTSVLIDTVENKRYTMRDIGSLETRIANLEYYTSLSMVEQDTKSLTITDSTGLDRMKNGFIVDSFTGHNIGDVTSPDYLCSVDMQNGELRPFYSMNNVNLVETLSSDTDRTNAGYKLYGDVITLPVIGQPAMIRQQYGSRLENINPFAVFTFLGDVKMNPSSDDWFETQQAPDIVRNVEGNFNTIAALAIQAGILGTIWNAWQVSWAPPVLPPGGALVQYTTGSNWANQRALDQGAIYVDVNTFNNRFGVAGGGGPARQVYAETYAQTGSAYRTGLKTTLAAQYEQQLVDDKIISTAIIPYIRSRNILVQSKKLKPNTTFYPYFDNIAVGQYCTPASYITYTLPSATSTDFDFTSNAGGLANDPTRVINYTAGKLNADAAGNMCLNTGDVITGGTSGATAVVIGLDHNLTTDVRTLHVANIQGTFVSSETITGSISGAIGTTTTTHEANKSQGSKLTTNYRGDLNFIFWMPNDSSTKFRTGTREFKLLDVSTVTGQQSSSAKIQYEATGVLETRQRTINSIRNAHLIQEIVAENDTVSRTIERVTRDTGWYDPLAQTFLVQQKGGAFLSKVDIFFATKDQNLPVTLEIREVVNGYPGQRVLPFSKVTLNPADVKLSANTVQLTDGSGANYPAQDTPTTFTFPSPVYVQENQEYALVLASDSNNYKVWISQMGDLIPGSSRTISEQPYLGSLFKSQNATTWTAAQDQDLMFTIYRCQFDTGAVGSVQFSNDVIPNNPIDINPFEIVSGSNKLRVWHMNHGLFFGSRVAFDNLDTTIYKGIASTGTITTSNSSTTVTGVGTAFISEVPSAGSVLYRSSDGKYLGVIDHVVSDTSLVLRSNCTTTIGTAATFKIADSLNGIPVTEIYEKADPNNDLILTVSDVDLDSYCVTVTTSGTATGYVGGDTVTAASNILYDIIQPSVQLQNFSDTTCDFTIKTTSGKSVDGGEVPYQVTSGFSTVVANDNNLFHYPQVVASPVNQNVFTSAKTLTLQAVMTSTNDALSPMLDTHRISAITISNKVNSPTENNTNVSAVDNRFIFNGSAGAFSFSGYTITTSNAAIAALIPTLSVGKYITISGATTSGNNGTYLITGIAGDGSTTGTVTVSRATTFTSESAVSGTTVNLRVLFVDEISPVGSSTVNKYISKAISLANPSTFIRVKYSVNCPTEANVLVYYKTSPVGSTVDFNNTNWTLATPDTNIVQVINGDPTFYDVGYSINGLSSFDKVKVKLVLQSTNSAAVPRVKDLRIICCA
jgi:hypothetical protein